MLVCLFFQIYVNQKKVKLPFENTDVRATENGTESLVVISEIDAHISFTGTMFSIRLPWQKFHGNTEGQCGRFTVFLKL